MSVSCNPTYIDRLLRNNYDSSSTSNVNLQSEMREILKDAEAGTLEAFRNRIAEIQDPTNSCAVLATAQRMLQDMQITPQNKKEIQAKLKFIDRELQSKLKKIPEVSKTKFFSLYNQGRIKFKVQRETEKIFGELAKAIPQLRANGSSLMKLTRRSILFIASAVGMWQARGYFSSGGPGAHKDVVPSAGGQVTSKTQIPLAENQAIVSGYQEPKIDRTSEFEVFMQKHMQTHRFHSERNHLFSKASEENFSKALSIPFQDVNAPTIKSPALAEQNSSVAQMCPAKGYFKYGGSGADEDVVPSAGRQVTLKTQIPLTENQAIFSGYAEPKVDRTPEKASGKSISTRFQDVNVPAIKSPALAKQDSSIAQSKRKQEASKAKSKQKVSKVDDELGRLRKQIKRLKSPTTLSVHVRPEPYQVHPGAKGI